MGRDAQKEDSPFPKVRAEQSRGNGWGRRAEESRGMGGAGGRGLGLAFQLVLELYLMFGISTGIGIVFDVICLVK